MLGLSLGLLFTPCAGPVIAAVVTVAATQSLTLEAFLITLAYGLGRRARPARRRHRRAARHEPARRRAHAPAVRRGLGVAILGVVVLMILGVDKDLQTRVPEYTRALQRLEESASARTELDDLVGSDGDRR